MVVHSVVLLCFGQRKTTNQLPIHNQFAMSTIVNAPKSTTAGSSDLIQKKDSSRRISMRLCSLIPKPHLVTV